VTSVQETLKQLGMAENFALFISAPLFVPLVKHLSPRVLAFDAQDNLLKASLYKDLPHLSDYYQFCIQRADLLLANSAETTNWLAQQRVDAQHIANGVSPTMFDAHKSYPIPADLARIAHPRVGYAGKMQEMFDVKLMCMLAEHLPHVNFVFFGQQLNRQWMRPLWSYPNVFYLGDKQYESLPSYIAGLDICIIPYRPEAQHGGDPIKFYEYLAMGKPIITTNIGGVGEFREYPQVCIADTPEQFEAGLTSFLHKLSSHTPIELKALPSKTFWSTKADQIVQQITALAQIKAA
jgi:teichuronic acid biosynthesis glycosyltransferase TuaH